eukprot:Skav224211  [mRNA]  locus=scaffold939:970380:972047:- [translate_table: standard]
MAKLAVADRILASEKEKRLLLEMQLASEKEKCQAIKEECAVLEERILAREKEKCLLLEMQLAGEKEKCQAIKEECALLEAREKEKRLALEMQLASEKEKLEAQVRMQEHRLSRMYERCQDLERQLAHEKEKRQAAEEKHHAETEKGLAVEMQLAHEKGKRQAEKEKREAVEMELVHKCRERQAVEQKCAALEEDLSAVKSQLKIQQSTCGVSQGALWQYEMDGRWEAFTSEGNEKMHKAYLKYLGRIPNSRYATINSGGVPRTVDFERMEQQHSTTGKVRQIRLSAGVPSEWVSPTGDLLQQGNALESLYQEVTNQIIWDAVRNVLQHTGHAWDGATDCSCMSTAEIKSVHRVEHFCLWHRYKARLAAMRQDHAKYGVSVGSADLDLDGPGNTMAQSQKLFDCGEDLALDVDEKILLHGTSRDNANAIVREGFDHRTCRQSMYGAGVYFACAACKSHQYTCDQHKRSCRCKHERTLIIARVALGDAYVAAETRTLDRRPPVRSDASGSAAGTYDSIVVKPGVIQGHHNPNQVHQEFVIFDREQAYPCYVVQYTVG